LNNADALAFNGAGDLFVACWGIGEFPPIGDGHITEITPGGAESTFATGLSSPSGLAFNSAGDLFEADYDSGNIYEFTPSGAKSTFASGLDGPMGLAFDGAGDLFVADWAGDTITEITPGGAKSTFASGWDYTALAFQGETLLVPEPSALGLLAFGVPALLICSRRARRC
jgi:DNA-binding beta-propeller fold protein YncE